MESCRRYGMSASLSVLVYTFVERRWMGMNLGNDIAIQNTSTFTKKDDEYSHSMASNQ